VSLNLPVLAIDPGKKAGGAALLSSFGNEVIKAWAWTERTRKGETVIVLESSAGGERLRNNLHDVGDQIARDIESLYGYDSIDYAMVVEGLFVGLSKKESMTLSWCAGLVASPLLPYAVGELMRPTPMQWRPEVVRIPGNTKAKDAADLAIKWVAENLPGVGALADNEHACEAACQAVYGWRYVNGRLAA
jgi:hypothetical protein